MTKEEAIQMLRLYEVNEYGEGELKTWYNGIDKDMREALDMAIEALEILGDDGIVNCCGCIHWTTDGGAMMICELWDTPMGDFDYCSYGKRSEEGE